MVLSFIKYFFIGVMYYVFNFLYSLLDLWIIFFYCFFRFEGRILNKIKVFVGYVLLKFLVFYFYFFYLLDLLAYLKLKSIRLIPMMRD